MIVHALLFFLCHLASAGSEGSEEGDFPEREVEGGAGGVLVERVGSMMDQTLRSSRTDWQRTAQVE